MKQVKVLLTAGIGVTLHIIGALLLTLRKHHKTWGVIPNVYRRY